MHNNNNHYKHRGKNEYIFFILCTGMDNFTKITLVSSIILKIELILRVVRYFQLKISYSKAFLNYPNYLLSICQNSHPFTQKQIN